MAKGRFRRRIGKRRRYGRRRFRARRLVKFIKRTIKRNTEIKYAVGALGPQAVDPSIGLWDRVTPIFTQGIAKDQRIGDKIQYKFLQLRARIRLSDGTSIANPVVATLRVLLLQPRLNPTAGPTYTLGDWFDFGGNNVSRLTSPMSNVSCRVLMDRTYTRPVIQGANNWPFASPEILIKKKVRINNKVNFRGATEDLPTDPKDNYYFVVIGDGAANDVVATTYWTTRLSFYDL